MRGKRQWKCPQQAVLGLTLNCIWLSDERNWGSREDGVAFHWYYLHWYTIKINQSIDTGWIFKQCTAGLNSKFSFSLTGYCAKALETCPHNYLQEEDMDSCPSQIRGASHQQIEQKYFPGGASCICHKSLKFWKFYRFSWVNIIYLYWKNVYRTDCKYHYKRIETNSIRAWKPQKHGVRARLKKKTAAGAST